MDVPFIEQVRGSWVDLNRSSHWLPRRGANHATAPLVAIPRPSMSTMATVGQVVAEASPLDAHLDGCFGSRLCKNALDCRLDCVRDGAGEDLANRHCEVSTIEPC